MKLARILPLTLLALSAPAQAFPYLVREGETLARIAERVYGDPKAETVLAAANALDRNGGIALVSGTRIEVPAEMVIRAKKHDSWGSLAQEWLGSSDHAGELAGANQSVPWKAPESGQEVHVFAVVTHVVGPKETVSLVAKRYGIDPKVAWKVATYNKHKGDELTPGQLLSIPLPHLGLSPTGRVMLAAASEAMLLAAGGEPSSKPKRDEAAELVRRLRAGEWAATLELGQRFARTTGADGGGARALGYRVLLEAYAATGERERARLACTGWRANDTHASAAVRRLSPKLQELCDEASPKR